MVFSGTALSCISSVQKLFSVLELRKTVSEPVVLPGFLHPPETALGLQRVHYSTVTRLSLTFTLPSANFPMTRHSMSCSVLRTLAARSAGVS